MMLQSQRGFSLIETLVAAMIIFSVLVSAFVAFQGSILASGKAQARLELLAVVPHVRAEISEQLLSKSVTSGQGAMGDVTFDWRAMQHATGYGGFDEGSSETFSQNDRRRQFILWTVKVDLALSDAQRSFQFSETTWRN